MKYFNNGNFIMNTDSQLIEWGLPVFSLGPHDGGVGPVIVQIKLVVKREINEDMLRSRPC